jgi:hypothetical protein
VNPLISFAIDFATTLVFGLLIFGYLRIPLHRLLVDLCGTEERARFWLAFSSVLLLGTPLAAALGYSPPPAPLDDAMFIMFRQFGQNLMAFLVALVGLGIVVSFFALVAPRASKERTS